MYKTDGQLPYCHYRKKTGWKIIFRCESDTVINFHKQIMKSCIKCYYPFFFMNLEHFHYYGYKKLSLHIDNGRLKY